MSAATVNYPEEGAGIALAAKKLDIPAVIGFTLETDGSLPDGTGAQLNTNKIWLEVLLENDWKFHLFSYCRESQAKTHFSG